MGLFLQEILSKCNQYLTFYLVFPGIVLLGIYLTLRLRVVQFSKFKLGLRYLFKKEEGAEGNITHYEAVSSVLASNFGTGNISGMGVALAVGGPGACIWMWVMTFFGMAIQYSNCLLGVKYRKKDANNEYVGGAMYYLSSGLGLKKLAGLFAVCVIVASFSCGGFAQVNSIALPLQSLGVPGLVTGLVLALFVGIVVIGGAHRVAVVSSKVVPAMAILYFVSALIILALHFDQVGAAFVIMFKSAFGARQAAAGVFGFALMRSLTTGFDRAIFATDAGTGTVPVLQSGAKTTHPVIDGAVSLVSPVVVMLVCTTTALVLIVTGAFADPALKSTNMVISAFQHGLTQKSGLIIVLVSLVLFGYTTTLAWASCLQRAVGYLFGVKYVKAFQWLYIVLVPAGALMHVDVAWILADIALTSMLVINLIGVAGLSKEVIVDSQEFSEKLPELATS